MTRESRQPPCAFGTIASAPARLLCHSSSEEQSSRAKIHTRTMGRKALFVWLCLIRASRHLKVHNADVGMGFLNLPHGINSVYCFRTKVYLRFGLNEGTNLSSHQTIVFRHRE